MGDVVIPASPTGYAVNERTGEVHIRWADHAKGLRRTTAGGLFSVLGDLAPVPCPVCFTPPPELNETPPCALCGRRHVEGSGIAQDHATRLAEEEALDELADTDGGS